MKTKIKRREAFTKAAAVAGTLLALNTEAAPAPWWQGGKEDGRSPRKFAFAGSWIYQGLPCAIFQEGAVILAINEAGNIGTAQVTGPNTITVIGGGWDFGLIGVLDSSGRIITWSNETVWTRAQ